MADGFFEEKAEASESGEQEGAAEDAPETIKLGETEYKPEELQAMVGVASKVKEFSDKSGTDFDGLTKSWGKRGDEIGKLKADLEEFKTKNTQEKVATGAELSEEEQRLQAQDQARNLGLVTDKHLDDYFEKKLSQREQAKTLLSSCKRLSKKIDGSDGRPAFDTKEVLTYMQESGVKKAQDAYDLKYKSELGKWRDGQLNSKRPRGLTTEESSSAGGKKPPDVKVTRDNLGALVKESLYSS